MNDYLLGRITAIRKHTHTHTHTHTSNVSIKIAAFSFSANVHFWEVVFRIETLWHPSYKRRQGFLFSEDLQGSCNIVPILQRTPHHESIFDVLEISREA